MIEIIIETEKENIEKLQNKDTGLWNCIALDLGTFPKG